MKRIIGTGTCCYHLVSRVVDRTFRFGVVEKNRFRDMMWRVAAFSGVRLLTYAVMSNHFHMLVELPDAEEGRNITDEELVRRVGLLYSRNIVKSLEGALAGYLAKGDMAGWKRLRAIYLYRMCSLSEFMKTFKQRFSVWYNRTHQRKGTLWEERFRSVLVQGRSLRGEQGGGSCALLTVAAYIELNAVRAGIVDDPKKYRWCGYGEAVAGVSRCRAGICSLLGCDVGGWRDALSHYRSVVFGQGDEENFKSGALKTVLAAGDGLSKSELLRCRVRYFSDGLVMGCRDFVEDVFRDNRRSFGTKRRNGARKLQGGDWGDIYALRDLKKEVISCY